MGQTLNRFTIIKSITIILMYVPQLKKNLSYFSLLTHTHTHTHTHTNYLSQRQQHFTLSFLFSSAHTTFSWLSFLSLSGFLLAALSFLFYSNPYCCTLFNMRHLLFAALTFLLHFSQAKILFLALGFTLYFLSSHREDPLGPKPSNFLQHCLLIGLFSYSLLDQEYITSLTRNRLSFHTKKQYFLPQQGNPN